ncbi:MAG: hypothetical protein DHS80DRAFT_29739 [Piptocephalis tieghemiana]|nr:MAG: hypothetical protein DHS80DRAFT_29739 [Piptocephalis tieghemiana]
MPKNRLRSAGGKKRGPAPKVHPSVASQVTPEPPIAHPIPIKVKSLGIESVSGASPKCATPPIARTTAAITTTPTRTAPRKSKPTTAVGGPLTLPPMSPPIKGNAQASPASRSHRQVSTAPVRSTTLKSATPPRPTASTRPVPTPSTMTTRPTKSSSRVPTTSPCRTKPAAGCPTTAARAIPAPDASSPTIASESSTSTAALTSTSHEAPVPTTAASAPDRPGPPIASESPAPELPAPKSPISTSTFPLTSTVPEPPIPTATTTASDLPRPLNANAATSAFNGQTKVLSEVREILGRPPDCWRTFHFTVEECRSTLARILGGEGEPYNIVIVSDMSQASITYRTPFFIGPRLRPMPPQYHPRHPPPAPPPSPSMKRKMKRKPKRKVSLPQPRPSSPFPSPPTSGSCEVEDGANGESVYPLQHESSPDPSNIPHLIKPSGTFSSSSTWKRSFLLLVAFLLLIAFSTVQVKRVIKQQDFSLRNLFDGLVPHNAIRGSQDSLWEVICVVGEWYHPPPSPPPSPWDITPEEREILLTGSYSDRIPIRDSILRRRIPRRDGHKEVLEAYPLWLQGLFSPPKDPIHDTLAHGLDQVLEIVFPTITLLSASVHEGWREGHWSLEWASPRLREWLDIPIPPPRGLPGLDVCAAASHAGWRGHSRPDVSAAAT